IVLTPLAHRGQFHGGDTPSDFARYRRADAITTMTDWENGWFASEGLDAERIVTTGMGPNAVRSRDGLAFRAAHGIPAGSPLVLYIGRKERYKGYIHILDGVDGFCVRQRADDVASAIQRLLDDSGLRSSMGRAGALKLREKWDWERVIDRVEEAYARALAHAHADVGEALA